MTKHYTDEGTLLIRNSDIKDGKFEFGDNPIYLEKTFAEKNETRMHQIGDVITVHTGDVGTSAVITENEAKSIGFATIVTRPNPKIIDSNYLCSFLNTDKHKKWAVSISTGDGRTNYNLGDYFELVVPVPSIAEQKKIASYIQKLNRLITLHQCKCQIDGCRFQSPLAITWEQRKFSDLVQIERGGSPRPIDDFITDSPDGLNWVKIGDAPAQGNYITKTAEKIKPEGLSKTREVHPGDLILSNSMSFGKPYIMGIDGCIHDGWLLIRNTYKAFDLTFLCHLLGTPQMIIQYKSLAAGSTVNNLNKELVGNTVVTIPTIKEQRVLGQYLETLDNLITLHQREFAFLCKEKSKKFRYIKNAWEQRKVREVTDRYDNLRIPVAASLRVAGTTPYYGANGIQDYVDGYTHDGEFILVAEDGANDLKNYPVKCVKGRIWVNNHAHVLQGKYDCADNQFLAYAISQADIESLLVGGGRAKLNAETLMGIDLLLPKKAEQIRIGKYLAQLDNLITLHQRELEKLKNLKKACLDKMFV